MHWFIYYIIYSCFYMHCLSWISHIISTYHHTYSILRKTTTLYFVLTKYDNLNYLFLNKWFTFIHCGFQLSANSDILTSCCEIHYATYFVPYFFFDSSLKHISQLALGLSGLAERQTISNKQFSWEFYYSVINYSQPHEIITYHERF